METYFFFKGLIKYFELAAAFAGLLTWLKWRQTDIRWFTVYLFFITACEFAGFYLARYKEDNAWLYNFVVTPAEILFFCWLFYRFFAGSMKRLALTGAILYIMTAALEIILLRNAHFIFKSLAYSLAMLVLLMLVICYFHLLFRSAGIIFFRRDMMFWISLGLLLFYLGTFPLYGLYNQLAKNIPLFLKFSWVMIFLNYAMYLLFIIGFIWAKPKPRSL